MKAKATAIFVAGLPGGLAMIGTIPADLTQFMGHYLRIVQKLAYLSGMPGFSSVDDMADDVANMVLIYIGVMFGEANAKLALHQIAKHLAGVALKQIPKNCIDKSDMISDNQKFIKNSRRNKRFEPLKAFLKPYQFFRRFCV